MEIEPDPFSLVARDKIRETIGSIGAVQLIEIERAVAVWLGIPPFHIDLLTDIDSAVYDAA